MSLSKHQLLAECAGIRCIAHIDLDCFYCQVEHKRLGIPMSIPLAVQQWQAVIAVNYAARAAGVKRHETAEEALKKCPDLRLVHVATYSDSQIDPDYYPDPSILTHKVSLEPYRRASVEIFKVISSFTSKFEKASVDEGYIDLTQEIVQAIIDSPPTQYHIENWGDTYIIGEKTEPTLANYALYLASNKIKQIRASILEQLKFTCSAGISHNKTLAKLCSSRHKPNKQTALPLESVHSFLDPIPITSIPYLGGKLGTKVSQDLNIITCGELRSIPLEKLHSHFDPSTAHWLLNISQGICEKAVIERKQTKSMMAAKSFRPTITNLSDALQWLSMLCNELWVRVRDDADLNQRWPSNLTVTIQRSSDETSQSCSFPTKNSLKLSPDPLVHRAKPLLSVPCSRLMIQCSGFQKLATNSIESWLRNGRDQKTLNKRTLIEDQTSITKSPLLDLDSKSDSSSPKPKHALDNSSFSKDTTVIEKKHKSNFNGVDSMKKKVDSIKKMPKTTNKRKLDSPPLKQPKISFFMKVAQSNASSAPKDSSPTSNDVNEVPSTGLTSPSTSSKLMGLSDSSLSIKLEECTECKELFPSIGMQEHMDWHYAKKLQKTS